MKNKDIFTFRDAEKQAGPVAFSTMLKPAGSACNLDCHYCYYLDEAVQYGGRQAVMSDELLELYVKQYIEANEVPTVQFCWHGGEPLLLGVDFYRKAMDFQQKYADGKKIENILQTNGTLVDEAWCDLFAGNNFLVGISLDGPQDIHDAFRLPQGGPLFVGQRRRADQFGQRFAVHFRGGSEYGHLFAVSSVSARTGYPVLRDAEMLRQRDLQPRAVQCGQRADLRRLQAGVEQRNQSGNVGRIKHHDHMLHVGTIVAEVFAELRGDLGVAFQQVFARHARFAAKMMT